MDHASDHADHGACASVKQRAGLQGPEQGPGEAQPRKPAPTAGPCPGCSKYCKARAPVLGPCRGCSKHCVARTRTRPRRGPSRAALRVAASCRQPAKIKTWFFLGCPFGNDAAQSLSEASEQGCSRAQRQAGTIVLFAQGALVHSAQRAQSFCCRGPD